LLIFYGFAFATALNGIFQRSASLFWALSRGLYMAASAPEPGWAISQATVTLRAYLIFVAVMNTLKTPKDLYYVAMAILAGFAFESILGFWQWRYGPMGLTFLGERVYMYDWRSMGTFFVTSYYGNYLILLIPVAYRLFIYYRPFRKWETYVYGGMTLFSVFALFSTYGRGPWISVIISLGLITLFSFLNKKHRPRVKWAIGMLIVFGFAFAVKYAPVIIDQFGPQRQAAADVRKDEWRTAVRVIKNNLIFGAGSGNYENLSVNYVTPEEVQGFFGWQIAEMVHNSYLLVTAENGIPGGMLFVSWFLLIFRRLKTAKLRFLISATLNRHQGFFALPSLSTIAPTFTNTRSCSYFGC
jgi:O-antigen ligase